MIFDFPYYVSGGKGDSSDCVVSVELSDEDTQRLFASAKTGEFFRLSEDKSIRDLYDKVYNAVLKQERQTLEENPEVFDDWFSWEYDYEPDAEITDELFERYWDELEMGINYPEELSD